MSYNYLQPYLSNYIGLLRGARHTISSCEISLQNEGLGIQHERDLDIIQSGGLHERYRKGSIEGTTDDGTQILIRRILTVLYGTNPSLISSRGTTSSSYTVLKC